MNSAGVAAPGGLRCYVDLWDMPLLAPREDFLISLQTMKLSGTASPFAVFTFNEVAGCRLGLGQKTRKQALELKRSCVFDCLSQNAPVHEGFCSNEWNALSLFSAHSPSGAPEDHSHARGFPHRCPSHSRWTWRC